MQKTNRRFKGRMTSNYDLLLLAAPHYVDCQQKIGEILKTYFSTRKAGRIEILEMGCGNGHTSEVILKADERIYLTAVDNEPEMIKQAKRRLEGYIKKERIKIVKSDALKYVKESKAEKFDAFVTALTIHNFKFDYRRKFIKETCRLLKPGGIFINMDRYAQDNEKVFKKGLDWQIGMYKKVFSRLGKEDLIEKWLEHEDHDSRPDVIMKEGAAVSDMKKSGFKNIKFVYRKKTYSILTARKQ